MAPELLNSIDAQELQELAQRVREYQESKKLSDNGLFKKFSGLGSTTTYKKILSGKLQELDLERQLTNYRAVVALIESIQDEELEEEIFEDLLGPLELKRSWLETQGQSTIARFILLEADTGLGKTCAGKALIKKYGTRFLMIEASDVWNDKPIALLRALLKARGVSEVPNNTSECLELAVKIFNQSRIAVIIDEGHHLGPHCLNTIKTLLNRTPGEFLIFAMRTLWNRLERAAYEEVRQLTGNRLSERIKLSLRETDVKKLLDRRLDGLNGDVKKAVEICMKYAPMRGNLGFVRAVCRRARDQADKEPVSLEIFTNAVQAEVERR